MSYRPILRLFAALTALAPLCLLVPPGLAAPPAAAAVDIVPHRAIYRLSLLSARNSSPVADVSGRMLFQWADACDAWTVEQHFRMNFVYNEGEEVRMTTNYATWEAKSGAVYRFNVRKTVDGQFDDEVKGQVTADSRKQGATVTFTKPETDALQLSRGTLFPSRHTLTLLEKALAGEHLVSRTVFDGSDPDGPTEVSAVIGKRTMLKDGIAITASPRDRPTREVLVTDAKRSTRLLSGAAWPIRLAFFPTHSDSSAPEYEMSLLMLHNGVAEAMQIDYGDFTVNAVLETLEPLPKSGC